MKKLNNKETDIISWTRKIKVTVAFSILIVVFFYNMQNSEKSVTLPEGFWSEFFSLKNLTGAFREYAILAVILVLYYLARSYNDKLDRQEEI